MIRLLDLSDSSQRAQASALRAASLPPPEVAQAVARIVADVRARGDEAVRELTRKFDGPDLEDPFLREADWDALSARCRTPPPGALKTS